MNTVVIFLALVGIITFTCIVLCIFVKRIRFGILFANTSNLGDDVQTIAQMQYIPKNAQSIIVNRENLHKETRKSIVIMNGWFMHNPKNWPPNPSIHPIFISFHIEKKELINKQTIPYYKKYEPIGCRDEHTMILLQKHGIKAYLSGCLTLTLRNPFTYRTNKIYIVDAHLTSKKVYPWGADHLLHALVPQDIRDQAEYIEHEIPSHIDLNDMNQRQQYVKQNLLNKYATARLVITSRLHAALPCVAYNTPCLVLQSNFHTDNRFSGLRHLLHGCNSVNDTPTIDFYNPQPKITVSQLRTIQENIRTNLYQRLSEVIA